MAGVQRNRGLKAWQGSQLDDITIPKPPTSALSQTQSVRERERDMGVEVSGPRLFIITKQYKADMLHFTTLHLTKNEQADLCLETQRGMKS